MTSNRVLPPFVEVTKNTNRLTEINYELSCCVGVREYLSLPNKPRIAHVYMRENVYKCGEKLCLFVAIPI